MPKLKASEFGVRKVLLRKPTKKMGDLVVPQLHLKKVESSEFFYVKKRENGRDKKGLMSIDICVPAGVCGRLSLLH